MGAVRLIYDETIRQFKRLGWWGSLNTQGTREIMQGRLRYCLQDNILYLPEDQNIINEGHKICWGRIRFEEFEEEPWLSELAEDAGDIFDKPIEVDPLDYHKQFTGIGFGVMYSKRHRETPAGRIAVSSFVSQALIDQLAEHPEAMEDVSKEDFESLVAELYARMGCDVDLYRKSKDSGIDFLAVRSDEASDPVILCVQCKHPDKPTKGKKRRTLPVATVREIFGVAKAYNLSGAVVVTSSVYSPEAKLFADKKPEEITLANAQNLHQWIREYRWNKDE